MPNFFSVVSICRNEEQTLPAFFDGLKGYLEYPEADIVLCDTGSNDNTIKIAKSYQEKYPGKVQVIEAGDIFKREIKQEHIDKFIKDFGFAPTIKVGERYFHFADARNHASSFSKHDWIFCSDIDEKPTWDIPKIINVLPNEDHLLYEFCFAHKPDGSCAIQFAHSKFFRKSKIEWKNGVHEVEGNKEGCQAKPPKYVDFIFHHHWQNPHTHRGNYLGGLELACINGENLDRNLYYLAREYFWKNKLDESLKTFDIALRSMWWKPERGQAYIWMGLTHKYRKEYDKAEGCFYKSLAECNTRREAFWELGVMYDETNRPEQAVIALEAALAIPFKPQGYLANMHLYGWLIPDKLAQIYAKMGRKEDSKRNWLLCLKNKPDKRILANLPYYYGYNLPLISIVVPTCRPEGFQRLVSSIREHTVYPRYEIIEKSGPGTAVEKFNDGVREANGDFIVFLADDCEVELGWLEQAFVCFKERFRDRGLVIFNDHYYNGTLAGHFFCSRNIREDLDD